MTNVVLMVVTNPDPTQQSVVSTEGLHPVIMGEGGTNFLCGECGFTVAEAIPGAALQGFVLQCPRCNAYNQTRL